MDMLRRVTDLTGMTLIFSDNIIFLRREKFSRSMQRVETEEGCMTFADHLRLVAIVAAFGFVAAVLIGMI
jgi:adenylate kinase